MERVDQIREHARKHYNEGGWDHVIECWEDEDILEVIDGAISLEEAVQWVEARLKPISDYRDDIQGEIF